MKSRAAPIFDLLAVLLCVLVLLASGCGAGTSVALNKTTETLNASGAVVGRSTETVERRSRAINTKVELKDLQSTVSYGGTNGLASGLSAGDVSAKPETSAIEAFQQGLGMGAAFYGVREGGSDSADTYLPIILELIRGKDSDPTHASSDLKSKLDELDSKLADIEAIAEALEAERQE